MKILKQPEDSVELLNVLTKEDVVLNIKISSDIDYELSSDSNFSTGKLSTNDILEMIEKVFADLGAVIHFK